MPRCVSLSIRKRDTRKDVNSTGATTSRESQDSLTGAASVLGVDMTSLAKLVEGTVDELCRSLQSMGSE